MLIGKRGGKAGFVLIDRSGDVVTRQKFHFYQSFQQDRLILADFLECWQHGPIMIFYSSNTALSKVMALWWHKFLG